jgi:hypothetical protein
VAVELATRKQAEANYYNQQSGQAIPARLKSTGLHECRCGSLWRRVLRRRSQRDGMTWERIEKIAAAWLPPPRILHSWTRQRFAVKHLR